MGAPIPSSISQKYKGDMVHVPSAYNAGPGVKKTVRFPLGAKIRPSRPQALLRVQRCESVGALT